MSGPLIGLLGVSGAGLWLATLIATGFNAVAVSLGLFIVLLISGRLS